MSSTPLIEHPQPVGQVWFVTLRLGETVHEQALGFTRTIHRYTAGAASENEAEALTRRWAEHKQIKVERIEARPALPCQRYVFPEDFLDQQLKRLDATAPRAALDSTAT